MQTTCSEAPYNQLFSNCVIDEEGTILVNHIETLEPGYAWSVMAHALFSAYQHLGGKMAGDDISRLTANDLAALRSYEQGIMKASETAARADSDTE